MGTSLYWKSEVPMEQEEFWITAWGQQSVVIAALNIVVARKGSQEIQEAVAAVTAIGTAVGFCLQIGVRERGHDKMWYQGAGIVVGLCLINAYFGFFNKDQK